MVRRAIENIRGYIFTDEELTDVILPAIHTSNEAILRVLKERRKNIEEELKVAELEQRIKKYYSE